MGNTFSDGGVFYINGQNAGVTTNSVSNVTWSFLGTDSSGENFKGLIDFVMVFPSTLSAKQIAAIYNNPYTAFTRSNTTYFGPISNFFNNLGSGEVLISGTSSASGGGNLYVQTGSGKFLISGKANLTEFYANIMGDGKVLINGTASVSGGLSKYTEVGSGSIIVSGTNQGILEFTNTDPVAPLSTTSPRAGKTNLNASNFIYKGIQSTYTGLGYGWLFGLAYRPETNTFFSIGNDGFPNFDLLEYNNTGPGGQFQLVKDWGNLNNVSNQLQTASGDWSMQGLWWDDTKQRLWISWGNYYNASHLNNQVLAYVTLDTGSAVVHGPWGVSASVGSDRVKSVITMAPSDIASITGNLLLMFGGNSNTNQDMSFGPGLVSVADPSSLVTGSLSSAEDIVYWPMQQTTHVDTDTNTQLYDAYANFPSGVNVIQIQQNGALPAGQTTIDFINDSSHFDDADGIYSYSFVQTGTIEGFIYTGRVASGYTWYGNPNDYTNIASIINPGQPLVDNVQTAHGRHADKWLYNAYFVNYQDVLNAATAVKNGTATSSTLQVTPISIASLATMGGTVPIGTTTANFPTANLSSFFDPTGSNYYLLAPDLEQIFIWQVGSSVSGFGIAQVSGTIINKAILKNTGAGKTLVSGTSTISGGKSIYNITGSGTSTISGTAIVQINQTIINITGSGAALVSGVSVTKDIYKITASGKTIISGVSKLSLIHSQTAGGTTIISGSSIVNNHHIYNITGLGASNVSGASVVRNIYKKTSSGKAIISGIANTGSQAYNITGSGICKISGIIIVSGGHNLTVITGLGITNVSGLAKVIVYPHKTFQYTPSWNCNITGYLIPVIPLSAGSIIKQKLFLHDRNSLAIIPAITVCNQKIADYV